MMLRNFYIFSLLSFISFYTQAQVAPLEEVAPPNFIKSIVLAGTNTGDQFPVLRLGEPLKVTFDDVNGDEADYYYKIVHCNYDWTPSNLAKAQYLKGFDNQRIINYENSFNTLQLYSNYRLTIPNRLTTLLLTGNYMLSIYNDEDELMFSRKFIVFQNDVNVGAAVHRTRDLSTIQQNQLIQFEINSPNLLLRNPEREVKVAILQNYQWNTAITNIKPQYTLGSKLMYRYNTETSFPGGNEFYNFDNKEIRGGNISIRTFELKDIYHNFLHVDATRASEPYTFYPDINGNFVVNTIQGDDPSIEADYAMIHFSLANYMTLENSKVYVYGRFNNYALTEENQLLYNSETDLYEAAILLKQGFYNYKYVVVNGKNEIESSKISGSNFETENDYLIIVYFRKFGETYDSIIGIGTTNSSVIKN
ncbi:hypothetical protein IMCC3317_39220 [Kordia antarctica]|uniref:Type 9 secretion system plug protein N-terminal domain-containing protein n=1 Tax=Kordia antarctica TaxID=1218801 RepID=A0A7L4ZPX3_9FLAO|nr:DUF5103 domain-containing protein [Kordia antarctica]QHI38529.1 hypothetical protein IMCC3317_39220 [Kordia antarctica]